LKGLIFIKKIWLTLKLLVFLFQEIIKANIRVAIDVLTPKLRSRPGIIALPLLIKRDIEITILSNLISLTPGTLTLAISPDKNYLYLHVMFIDDIDKLKQHIILDYECRIREIME